MAARWTAKRCGESFQKVGREGSSHYGIGYDGKIGQYVDEADTAWADSNWDSNCTSVTIENSNDPTGGPDWKVNDKTLNSLIQLCADIAQRNNLGILIPGQNLTWHQMYCATTCPGPYLISKMQYIADEANKIITGQGGEVITTETPVDIVYQVYTDQWLGNINQHNEYDPDNGFAGVLGQPISGVYVNASIGNIYYKVHTQASGWLPEVKNRDDYAGVFGQPIDGILIKSDSTTLHYQVHTLKDGWLPEVNGYNINDPNNGYAGILGHTIDGLMVWADPIITTTIVEKPVESNPPENNHSVQEPKVIYRIRKTWEDTKSQVGAFSNLESAILLCPVGYSVFDDKGEIVYIKSAPVINDPTQNIPPIVPEPETPSDDPIEEPQEPVEKDKEIKSCFTKLLKGFIMLIKNIINRLFGKEDK